LVWATQPYLAVSEALVNPPTPTPTYGAVWLQFTTTQLQSLQSATLIFNPGGPNPLTVPITGIPTQSNPSPTLVLPLGATVVPTDLTSAQLIANFGNWYGIPGPTWNAAISIGLAATTYSNTLPSAAVTLVVTPATFQTSSGPTGGTSVATFSISP